MSLRAELVRLGLRWFVKRKIGPATTLEALRRQDAFLARLVPPPPKGTQATHVDLDGVKAVAVVTPASLSGRLVLYLHGGGHVSGSPALYGDFTWRIAAATRARTVILDHRLAPEHPFPAALDDAVTAYRALVLGHVEATPLIFFMVIFFLVGVLSILIGFLAEIVIRGLYETQRKAAFYVREVEGPGRSE